MNLHQKLMTLMSQLNYPNNQSKPGLCYGFVHAIIPSILSNQLAVTLERLALIMDLDEESFEPDADLRSFFDTIQFHQYGFIYRDLLNKYLVQDALVTSEVVKPVLMEQQNASLHIQSKFTGIYTVKELTEAFYQLHEQIDSLGCIALTFNSLDHVVLISFDYRSHNWMFFDVDFPQYTSDPVELSEWIINSFEIRAVATTGVMALRGTSYGLTDRDQIDSFFKLPITKQNAVKVDSCDSTWLHMAALDDDINTVKELLRLGSNPLHIDSYNNTPMHLALRSATSNTAMFFLKYSFTPYALLIKNFNGCTPFLKAAYSGHLAFVEFLIKQELANFQEVCSYGNTALHLATLSSQTEMVSLLLRYDCPLNIQNKNGETPLSIAAKCGRFEIMNLLLNANASVNMKNKSSEAPLHLATREGHQDCVELLLKARADTDILNTFQQTPLHLACLNGYSVIASKLIEAGCQLEIPDLVKSTPLIIAAMYNHYHIVEYLLHKNAKFEHSNDKKQKLMHFAAQHGWTALIQDLVNSGDEINAVDFLEESPLHIAAEEGQLSAVKVLLKNGATIDQVNRIHQTALHLAVINEEIEVIKQLLLKKANPNIPDANGNTALHAAVMVNNPCILKLLLSHGAKNVRNVEQDTPSLIAEKNNYPEIIHILNTHWIDHIFQDSELLLFFQQNNRHTKRNRPDPSDTQMASNEKKAKCHH